jgi:hypothetical protein
MPDTALMVQLAAWIAVTLFGLAVGAGELVARYRDAPFAALRTRAALSYVAINGIAALFAYVLITSMDWGFGQTGSQKVWIQLLVAGFGSMVFFRSSLFTVKVGDTDVAVGPGIFFQVLMFATDRRCDRERAGPRAALVARIMQGVSFTQAKDALPNFCFELMQNVPIAEQQQFRQIVEALSAPKAGMRDSVKVLNLGLMLMNVVGSEVLDAAVGTLGERIQGPAKLETETLAQVLKADFNKAYPLLVRVSFIMSRYGDQAAQDKAREAVLKEIGQISEDQTLDNGTKMTLLALSLQQRVGDAVLMAALAHIADSVLIGAPARAVVPPRSADGSVVVLHQEGTAS